MSRKTNGGIKALVCAAWVMAGVGLVPTAASADSDLLYCGLTGGDVVPCGGEGEKACGVLSEWFWANGTGFCDNGLQAKVIHILEPIPALRLNAVLRFDEVDMVSVRQDVQDIIDSALNVGEVASGFGEDIDSFGSFWEWAFPSVSCDTGCKSGCGSFPACVELPSCDFDIPPNCDGGCLTYPQLSCDIKAVPQMATDVLNLASAVTDLGFDVLTIVSDLLEALFTIRVNVPLGPALDPGPAPSFSFSGCVGGTFSAVIDDLTSVPEVVTNLLNGKIKVPNTIQAATDNCINPIINDIRTAIDTYITFVTDLVTVFTGPKAICTNFTRHDWDAEAHVNADGTLDLTGPFGVLPVGNDLFEGDPNRGDGVGDVTQYHASWAYWARELQDDLADDEPLNWTQVLETHNAYNNAADGYLFPNQRYSLSDQLDLGVRWLELDPNFIPTPIGTGTSGHLRVCHGKGGLHLGCGLWDRLADNALAEIQQWLDGHPDEFIYLRLEDFFEATGCDGSRLGAFEALLTSRFGGRIYRRESSEFLTPWPSRNQLRAMGKQIIILTDSNPQSALLSLNQMEQESADGFFHDTEALRGACGASFQIASADEDGLLTGQDGQWLMYDRCGSACGVQVELKDEKIEYELVSIAVGIETEEVSIGPCNPRSNCEAPDPTQLANRDFLLAGELTRVYESRPWQDPVVTEEFLEDVVTAGLLNEPEAAKMGRCFISVFGMDYLHGKEETPLNVCLVANLDGDLPLTECRSEDKRLEASVWSYGLGDRGQNGDLTRLDVASGRLQSTGEGEEFAACGQPREGWADAWPDKAGGDWQIASCGGSWAEADERCWREFGSAYEFRPPVNGWQSMRLQAAAAGLDSVWVDLNDIEVEGAPRQNRRPTLTAADLPQAGSVHLEGSPIDFAVSAYADAEGHFPTFKWTFGDTPRTELCDLNDPPPAFGPSTSHTYGDNGPLPASTWRVDVLAIDTLGAVGASPFEVLVLNVPPTAFIDQLSLETGDVIGTDFPVGLVSLPVLLDGHLTDPGWLDTHTATVAWNDGAMTQSTVEQEPNTLSDVHVYDLPGDYTLTLQVTDDDGGVGSTTAPLTIVDAAGAVDMVIELLAGTPGAKTAVKWLLNARDKLGKGLVVPALDKLIKAIDELDKKGLGDESMRLFLALAAKSQAMAIIRAAEAKANGRNDFTRLAEAAGLIADGDALRDAAQWTGAIRGYRAAGRRVQGIAFGN